MRWFVLMIVAVACGTAPAQDVKKISNEELVELMKNPDIQLVDIRTPAEVAQGFIKGADKVNFFDEDFEAQMDKLDKSKPLAVYCKSGGRSGNSIVKLKALGFKEIYDVTGGFSGWKSEGFPVQKP